MNKLISKLVLISFALLASMNVFAFLCPANLTTNNIAVKNSLAPFCAYLQAVPEQKKKALIEKFDRIPALPALPGTAASAMQGNTATQPAPAPTAAPSNNAAPAKLVR